MKRIRKFIVFLTVAAVLVVAMATLAACNKNVTLSFEPNGGQPQASMSVKAGQSVTLPDLANRTDGDDVLVFDGWYTSESLEGDGLRGNITAPKSDQRYYAKWAKGIKITLNAGDGYIATTETYAKAGGKLLDAISQFVPTSNSGKAFSAWYLNGERVSEDTLMPDHEITVRARYKDSDGNHIEYLANAPLGTLPEGSMQETFVDFGEEATVSECAFTVDGYRFSGWTDVPNSEEVKYVAGDKIQFDQFTTRITLYAVWEKGIEDALGGSDSLYLDHSDSTKIYLHRKGIAVKQGTYNASTHEFTFNYEAGGKLQGKITGDYFYYFNKNLMRTYTSTEGGVTLTIGERYTATYAQGGQTKSGVVEYDPSWNSYSFSDGNGFVSRFVIETSQNQPTIRLQNMEEAGYYSTKDGYPVIFLNGLGIFTYYFDPDHPTYYDVAGDPVLVTNGTYFKNADGFFECRMYTVDVTDPSNQDRLESSRLEDFLFRVTDDDSKPVGDYDIKDKAIERSSFYGDLDPVNHSLYLNGFGGGTYTDDNNETHEGTYQIVHEFWLTLNGAEAMQTWIINFDYENSTQNVFYALSQDRNGNVTAALFGIVDKDVDGGVYVFDNPIVIEGKTYSDAFIMLVLDRPNETMILVKTDEQSLSSGKIVGIYAPYYTGMVSHLEEGETIYHYTDEYNENAQLNFTLSDGKAHYTTGTSTGELDKIEIAEGVIVDPNTGTATVTDGANTYQNVTYSFSKSEYIEFYEFIVSDSLSLYYYREVEYDDETYKKISGKFVLDYAHETDDLYNAYPARLLLLEDSHRAYIAIPMSTNVAEYVGIGTYAQAEGWSTEYVEYVYTYQHWTDKLLDYFGGDGFTAARDEYMSYYNTFTFRIETDGDNIGKFYAVRDNMRFDLDNFKADGYSAKATYTPDNGSPLNGTFYRMEIIIVFTADNGTQYYLKQNENMMVNVSKDAGLYYLYSPDDLRFMTFGPEEGGEYYDYIVFDGDGKVTVVTFDRGFLATPTQGTMVQSEKWSEDFREYIITEESLGGAGGKVYRVLLGTFETTWHEEYLTYDIYNGAFDGDWETYDGGRLLGNGYRIHPATYDVDGDGKTVYEGSMARATFAKDDTTTHAYTEDPNGDVIVFTYAIDEETSRSIVFDIATSQTGRKYLNERKLIFGSFLLWDAGQRPGQYMYLDGHGSAELLTANGTLQRMGTYRLAPEIDEVSYYFEDSLNKELSFYFSIYVEQESTGLTYFEYRRYVPNVDGEYESDDWAHLTMDSYGNVTYTDCYGVVYQGYYKVEGRKMTLYTFDGSGVTFTFDIDHDGGYFRLSQTQEDNIGA